MEGKTFSLATEAENMGEISVLFSFFCTYLSLKTIKLIFGG